MKNTKKTEPKDERCPNCGYCKHCGQSTQPTPVWIYPNYWYWPTYRIPCQTHPTITTYGTADSNLIGTSTGTSIVRMD